MAGRKNRHLKDAVPRDRKLKRQVQEAVAPRTLSMGTASHAPFGFQVQGELSVEDAATFSAGVTANGGVTITTTTAALTLPRMTTTQRNALTAAVGMIIYNTTDSKFQGYAGSSWVNLH